MSNEIKSTYPTREELGLWPANSILEDREQLFFRHWEEVKAMKEYLRERGESLVTKLGEAPLPTDYGDWTYLTFGDRTTGEHHDVLVFGNLADNSLGDGEDVLLRVHSACRTNEVFHSINCECREEMKQAMEKISQEGRGIIIYLEQEGRGTGIAGKMAQLGGMFHWVNGHIEQRRDENGNRIDTDRAYKEAGYPSEIRDFSAAAEILNLLGVKSVRMMTNNPEKIQAMIDAGIEVHQVGIHIQPDNPIIASDLQSKAENLGHYIDPEHYAYS